MKGSFPGQGLAAVRLYVNNGIYPLVEGESKSSWCWFLQCLGRAHSDLLLNDICEVFNGKIIGERYMRGFEAYEQFLALCNQEAEGSRSAPKKKRTYIPREREEAEQRLIDDYFSKADTSPKYTEEYFRRRALEAPFVVNERAYNKCYYYLADGDLGDVASLFGHGLKPWHEGTHHSNHDVATCWNIALNGHQVGPLESLIGIPMKKRKRFRLEDEPFSKDGKLSKRGRTITCQSHENIGHNKLICNGKGQALRTCVNNAEASGYAFGQAKPVVGHDSSGVGEVPNAYGLCIGVSQPRADVGVVLGESSVGGQPSVGVGVGSGS
nr:hypothetical protein [Tanacetum cinerariifolium]